MADPMQSPGGSSPRVRGTLGVVIDNEIQFRFIPACAGNTSPAARCPPQIAGSSPRVRGTRVAEEIVARNERFIPACAGNTWRDR